MYGDTEKGWLPIRQFVIEMTENYPELWEVAHRIEGMICGSGLHAGGVIFVDEPFIMPKIQIGLRPILCHEAFAMLTRV